MERTRKISLFTSQGYKYASFYKTDTEATKYYRRANLVLLAYQETEHSIIKYLYNEHSSKRVVAVCKEDNEEPKFLEFGDLKPIVKIVKAINERKVI